MKKVVLSLVAVAFFGVIALSSCKSGASTEATDSAKVEEPAAPAVDTAAAVADTAAADTAVAK